MRENYKLLLSVFLISVLFYSSYPQQYNFYNTQEKDFYSTSVKDTFKIFISLPDNYQNPNEQFPVIYILDGDIAFGMVTSIARYLEIGDNIPQTIIVGVSYGTFDKSTSEKRKRDFRPEQTGGAENFLKFLKEELFPFIDSNYRTVPGDRAIYGYSLAGLFSLYTLFTQPESFNRYIVGSPYLIWDDFSIYNYEENSIDKLSKMNIKLFISVGSEESDEKYFNPIDSLVTRIQQGNYKGLELDTKVFEGSAHLTGPAEAITFGLLSVFKKN
jgi:predicted alpha/beta superfamily hydrolase